MTKCILLTETSSEAPQVLELAGLEGFWAAIGGYVEPIYLDERTVMLVDEDGKVRMRAFNRRATVHWWLVSPVARYQDLVLGPALVIGRPIAAEFTDVADQMIAMMTRSGAHRAESFARGRWSEISTFPDYFEAAEIALLVADGTGIEVRVRSDT